MKKVIFVLLMSFALFTAVPAIAQFCPDVVGEWDTTIERVMWNWNTLSFSFQHMSGVMEVKEQKGCLFYGYSHVGAFSIPFTGVVRNRSVTVVGGDVLTNGMFREYNFEMRKFTVMDLIGSDFLDIWDLDKPDVWQGSGIGKAVRRLP